MFTSVTAFNTGHLSYINAPYIILPPNARSIETYGIAHSRVTYLIITYTAGTFAFNGSWNNSSTISYIYVPDTKVSAYSGRTVYPIIGREGIIEKDREFTLTIPAARYGWNSDLHWSVEENDYISIVSQGDGVATFRATGISPETDTTVTLSYQSNHGNGFFKGTKVLTVKPTPVIEFEDAEVKRICVANWGGGLSVITKVQGVLGELTYAQAAAVKSIDNKFMGNTVMTSFEEFQYFTGGVTSSTINNVRFANCTNLRKIIIPNMGNHILARWFFSNDKNLELVKVMEGNVRVDGWFVNECVKLKFLLMPSTLNQLAVASSGRYEHFFNTPATCAYIYKGTLPASVVSGSNTFSNAKGRFYVPDESVVLYKVSVGWSGVAARIFPMSQLPKDKPECPWLEELSEEGILRDYIDFEDAEVKRICCTNWGDYTEVVKTETVTEEEETVSISTVYTYVHKVNTAATRTVIKTITSSRAKTEEDEVGETSTITNYPLGMTKAQCAAVSSLGTVFNSNSVITKFNELKYFTNVHSINNGFVACTSLTEVDLSNITSLGTGALQSSGIIYVYAPLVRSASQGSGSTGWAASTRSLIGCLWKSLTSISVGGMYNSTNKYHIFLMETPPAAASGLNRWNGRTYVPDIYMSNYQEDSTWSSLVRSLSLLETDYPDCPWLDELREEGYIE